MKAEKIQRFLTEGQVSTLFGLSVHTLRHWRLMNKGPRYRKFGGVCRYDISDLEAYIHSVPTGGQAPAQ
jgi:predicted DNA-binding transcriptional regulator AlpA